MSDAPVVVEIVCGTLHIDAPTGLHRMSLLGAPTIPVDHIEQVEVTDKPINAIRGWRTGIGMPDLRMGTWRHHGVKVDDPEAVRDQIEKAQLDRPRP